MQPSRRTDLPVGVGMVETELMLRNPYPDQYVTRLDYGISAPLPARLNVLRRKLDDVKALVQTEPLGNDLRLFLFTVAASNDPVESTLVPLPPQFRAQVGHGCEVERLRSAIRNNWPSLRTIPNMFIRDEELLGLTSDEIDAWHLLHWVLMPNPAYPSFRRLSIVNFMPLCDIMGLGKPSEEPRQLISIKYRASAPQQWMWRQLMQQSRYYAFMGLPLEKVYRFLYTGGLDIPPGEPIRLHFRMESALQLLQLPQDEPPPPPPMELCWNHAVLSNAEQRAVIICELPAELDESVANSPNRQYIEFMVQDSMTLKPRYLLMFDRPSASRMMINWPGSPIDLTPTAGRSVVQRTSHRFTQVAHFFSQRLDSCRKVVRKINSFLAPNE